MRKEPIHGAVIALLCEDRRAWAKDPTKHGLSVWTLSQRVDRGKNTVRRVLQLAFEQGLVGKRRVRGVVQDPYGRILRHFRTTLFCLLEAPQPPHPI